MALDLDELEPRKAKPAPKDLTDLSIPDVLAYIADLEAEIARARTVITVKEKQRSGADALFKR